MANRGEIAIRITRAASELGIKSAAIYSSVDERALHVSMADEAVALPEGSSYLDASAVVQLAQSIGADWQVSSVRQGMESIAAAHLAPFPWLGI